MSAKYSISNYFGDKLTINENTIELKIKKGGFWSGEPMSSMWGGYKPVGGNPDSSPLLQNRHLPAGKYSIQITEIKSFSIHNVMLHISVDNSDKDISEIQFSLGGSSAVARDLLWNVRRSLALCEMF